MAKGAAFAALSAFAAWTLLGSLLPEEYQAATLVTRAQAAAGCYLGSARTLLHDNAYLAQMLAALLCVLAVTLWLCKPSVKVVYSDLKPRLPAGYPTRVTTTALRLPEKPDLIQCYEPATLAFLGEVPVTSPEGVRAAVARARTLQAEWARTSFFERRRVLRMIKAAILAQADAIVRLSCMDTGKPRVDAQFGEILASCGKLDWVIASGEAALAPDVRPTNLTSAHKVARVEYQPLGVIGVIAPWNYPFYNLYNHIASGLFAGNAVVLKISEYSAWSGSHFVAVARDVLAACGHNPDLVQLVQGFGETGAALVAAADKIIFTGSPGVGKAVMCGAAPTLTPLVLELGGKDPFIVCEDANVDAAITLAMRGTFQNSGQNCVGIERIYVYESIYEEFVAKARAKVAALRVGAPLDAATGSWADVDMGPITTAPQLPLIQALVDDAVAKGAQLLEGGRVLFDAATVPGDAAKGKAAAVAAAAPAVDAAPAAAPATASRRRKSVSASASADADPAPVSSAPASASAAAATGSIVQAGQFGDAAALGRGLFYAPTLLAGVTHDMRVANEEVFGPVMAIFKVPNNSDDAVVAMANSTAYGLGATVYSASPARANGIAARLHCGMVGVNAYGLNYLVQSLPFGGVRASGFDRFSGPEGLRACCLTKSVVTDWFSFLSIPTPVPKVLQYPVARDAPAFTMHLMGFQFAEGWGAWLRSIAGLAGLPVGAPKTDGAKVAAA